MCLRFGEKGAVFRLALAGRHYATASRFVIFKGKGLYALVASSAALSSAAEGCV